LKTSIVSVALLEPKDTIVKSTRTPFLIAPNRRSNIQPKSIGNSAAMARPRWLSESFISRSISAIVFASAGK
jgi:hypothetical protein